MGERHPHKRKEGTKMIVETRVINREKLRELCIEKNWYTVGTAAEYENFLTDARKIENVTTADIVRMAENILSHSDDFEEECCTVESVCFYIAKFAAYSWFEDVETI